MADNKVKSSGRILDSWAILLFMAVLILTYFRIFFLFKKDVIIYKTLNVAPYFTSYFVILCCTFTVFVTMIFLYLMAPYITTFMLVYLIPMSKLFCMLLLGDDSKMIKFDSFKNFVMFGLFIIMAIVLGCFYAFYLCKRITYNRFMLLHCLKYTKDNLGNCFYLIAFFILKIYALIIAMNLLEDFLIANKLKTFLPSIVPSIISIFTVIGTIKVLTSLLMIHEINIENSKIYSTKLLFMMIPTIYVNSFLFFLNPIASCISPIENPTNKTYECYNSAVNFIRKITSGFLANRSDFVIYYSFFTGRSYFPSVKNSSEYLKRRNIANMMENKAIYLTFLPSFICFSLWVKHIIDVKIFTDGRILTVPVLVTSIAFIEVINSRFEFLIFLYADRPALFNNNSLFKTLLDISKKINEKTAVVVNNKDIEGVSI